MLQSSGLVNAEMRARIEAFDWGTTIIGPASSWPASLRTVLALALDTEFAMMIMWGPDLVQLYNNGYIGILGDKHPRSLGQCAAECWADIWKDVGPLLRGVYERGEPFYTENLQLPMTRNGRIEQAYFTFSYSPIRDGAEIGGLICVVDETTVHVEREQELRESEARFRSLAASMPHIVLETDGSGAISFLSERFSSYTGLTISEGLGKGWTRALHRDDVMRAVADWQSAMLSGEPYSSEFRLRRADGVFRWHAAYALAQRNQGGRVLRWTGTITDVHDARRAVEEREFLSEASRLFSESLDLQLTLRNIAQLTVPRFADWCQIDLKTESGIQTFAIAHRDPEKNIVAQQFVGRVHLNVDSEHGSPYVIRTGQCEVVEALSGDVLRASVANAAELETYRLLGVDSFASIPLTAQGVTLGAISTIFGGSGRRFTADDLPMLEELGHRAGLAIQNASIFEREHRVAESFQEASLPKKLPEVHGLRFDAVYMPGSSEAQVGGDWYDAVRLLDGRVVISIGDVSGSGLNAAVRMGNMRQIIRGIAQVHADPSLMLDAADRALRLEHPDEIVTAFVAVIDPVAGTLAYASAGHPPPMLRYTDGRVEALSDGGLPLGLRQGRDASSGRVLSLTDASALILYTDGLTEAYREPLDGEQRLRALVEIGAVLSGPRPAQAVKDAFLGAESARDDVAILIVGIDLNAQPLHDAAPVRRWLFDVSDVATAQSARADYRSALEKRGAPAEDVFAAEVVFGELIGNVVRYAPGAVEISIDFGASAPVLHVFDSGPGFEYIPKLLTDVFSESGRGLYLVSALTEDFHVTRRPNGGSHARAVLTLNRARL